jgi:hypothetical protein
MFSVESKSLGCEICKVTPHSSMSTVPSALGGSAFSNEATGAPSLEKSISMGRWIKGLGGGGRAMRRGFCVDEKYLDGGFKTETRRFLSQSLSQKIGLTVCVSRAHVSRCRPPSANGGGTSFPQKIRFIIYITQKQKTSSNLFCLHTRSILRCEAVLGRLGHIRRTRRRDEGLVRRGLVVLLLSSPSPGPNSRPN